MKRTTLVAAVAVTTLYCALYPEPVSADDECVALLCPSGYNVIEGTDSADVLTGTTDLDCIIGHGGDDMLIGGNSDDVLFGCSGNDTLDGGNGNDTLDGGTGDDTLLGGNGEDSVSGGDGNDLINGDRGADSIDGGNGNDVIVGGQGVDAIDGGAGDDVCDEVGCEGINSTLGQCGTDAECEEGQFCVETVGICVYCQSDVGCDDGNPCTSDSCEPATGCGHVPAAPGTSCGLSNDDACDNPDTCDGTGQCVSNFEPATSMCRSATGKCDLPEYCDGAGNCSPDVFAAPGTPCEDGSACTLVDECVDGVCLGGQMPDCNDNNDCTDDTCDPASGCLNPPLPDGTVCDSEGTCYGSESCLAGGCVCLEASGVVFADPGFEECVRSVLGIPTATILPADCEGVIELDCAYENIVSLKGIEHFTNLNTLILHGNDIVDLTHIAELVSLRLLVLSFNEGIRIDPLANLTNLEELYLSRTDISDISVLAALSSLKKLRIYGNPYLDISAFGSGFDALEYLDLNSSEISDISPLANLPSLSKLYLERNNITDPTPIANKTNLVHLNLGLNFITDIRFAYDLTALTYFYLYGNCISDTFPASYLHDNYGTSININGQDIGCSPPTTAVCGDGVVGEGERCDSESVSCLDLDPIGYISGTAACTDNCKSWATETCVERPQVCGDGVVHGTEYCDGEVRACIDENPVAYIGGDIVCSDDCTGFDRWGCIDRPQVCGDGVISGTEVCDGDTLLCTSIKPPPSTQADMCEEFYSGGEASCNSTCTGWDEAGCIVGQVGGCGSGTQFVNGECVSDPGQNPSCGPGTIADGLICRPAIIPDCEGVYDACYQMCLNSYWPGNLQENAYMKSACIVGCQFYANYCRYTLLPVLEGNNWP